MTLNVKKVKDLEWIAELFPNLIALNLVGNAKIKSLEGLENLLHLKSLSLENLKNWKEASDLEQISGLKKLWFEVASDDFQIDLNLLPAGLSEIYIGPKP